MPCLLLALVLVGFAAYVMSGIACRLSGATGDANRAVIRVTSFIATFVMICFAAIIFLSKFRLMR